MASNEDPKTVATTDKAYEAAAGAVAAPAPKVEPKPVAKQAKIVPEPAPTKAASAKVAVKAAPAKTQEKPAKVAKPVRTKAVKPATKVAKPRSIKPAPAPAAKAKAAKTATKPAFAGLFTNFMLEDTTMDMSANFSGIQTAMTEAQAKAKEAFEKSTSMLGEAGDFAKGNVEAVMESGKILAEGVQGISSELVAESRSAFETMTGDIKELAAAKTPTDFFKLQGEMMRKNFDSAVAYGSKNSEAMLKLMSDVMAPISGRVSVAMEKARTTSL